MNFPRGLPTLVLLLALAPMAPAQTVFSFDYSLDSNNFFGTAGSAQRNTLEAAGAYLSSFLNSHSLSAISPTGTGTPGTKWTSTQPNPSTGSNFTLGGVGQTGPSIAANTIVLYVGGYNLPTANQIAFGSQGSWTWGWNNGGATAATDAWRNTVYTRGDTLMMPKIGAVSFDTPTSWYFDDDITTVESFSGYDFFSVAVHELVHVMGMFNGSSVNDGVTYQYGWTNGISGGNFTGANAFAANSNSNIALAADLDHWAEGKTSFIAGVTPVSNTVQEALMDPTFTNGVRKYLTTLDLAGLADIGYTTNDSSLLVNIAAIPEPATYAAVFGLGALGLAIRARRKRLS